MVYLQVRMSRMRKRIGVRLKDAQSTYAMLTTFNEVDMRFFSRLTFSNVISMRKRYGELVQKEANVRLGFLFYICGGCGKRFDSYACCECNHMRRGYCLPRLRWYFHCCVFPQGWHSAHARDLLCLCLEMWKDLTIFRLKERLWKCQTRHVMVLFLWRKWTGERLLLATGGVFGSLISTPILNPPQSAILGLHAIKDRAVVINGKVCPQ